MAHVRDLLGDSEHAIGAVVGAIQCDQLAKSEVPGEHDCQCGPVELIDAQQHIVEIVHGPIGALSIPPQVLDLARRGVQDLPLDSEGEDGAEVPVDVPAVGGVIRFLGPPEGDVPRCDVAHPHFAERGDQMPSVIGAPVAVHTRSDLALPYLQVIDEEVAEEDVPGSLVPVLTASDVGENAVQDSLGFDVRRTPQNLRSAPLGGRPEDPVPIEVLLDAAVAVRLFFGIGNRHVLSPGDSRERRAVAHGCT